MGCKEIDRGSQPLERPEPRKAVPSALGQYKGRLRVYFLSLAIISQSGSYPEFLICGPVAERLNAPDL